VAVYSDKHSIFRVNPADYDPNREFILPRHD